MNIYKSTLFFTLILLTSCKENINELETRIKIQAEENNFEMSAVEIKKTALYLSKWSKEDFYTEDIDKFKSADKISFPDFGNVLFVGSSSIRFWKTLNEDMKPFKVINRGFGGSHIKHINYHFKDIVKPYKPEAIVFFCGTNDIAALKTVNEVYDDFLDFFSLVNKNLPDTKIFIIGIKPSKARLYLKDNEMELNSKLRKLSLQNNDLFFISVWDEMLTEEGLPNQNLFIEDGLHVNAEGYALWTSLVKTVLEENL